MKILLALVLTTLSCNIFAGPNTIAQVTFGAVQGRQTLSVKMELLNNSQAIMEAKQLDVPRKQQELTSFKRVVALPEHKMEQIREFVQQLEDLSVEYASNENCEIKGLGIFEDLYLFNASRSSSQLALVHSDEGCEREVNVKPNHAEQALIAKELKMALIDFGRSRL